jgi:hypothetical protein
MPWAVPGVWEALYTCEIPCLAFSASKVQYLQWKDGWWLHSGVSHSSHKMVSRSSESSAARPTGQSALRCTWPVEAAQGSLNPC